MDYHLLLQQIPQNPKTPKPQTPERVTDYKENEMGRKCNLISSLLLVVFVILVVGCIALDKSFVYR